MIWQWKPRCNYTIKVFFEDAYTWYSVYYQGRYIDSFNNHSDAYAYVMDHSTPLGKTNDKLVCKSN